LKQYKTAKDNAIIDENPKFIIDGNLDDVRKIVDHLQDEDDQEDEFGNQMQSVVVGLENEMDEHGDDDEDELSFDEEDGMRTDEISFQMDDADAGSSYDMLENFRHLVHGYGCVYNNRLPVMAKSDIIHRLEHSLGTPNSIQITADWYTT
jgi:hypothetical protein